MWIYTVRKNHRFQIDSKDRTGVSTGSQRYLLTPEKLQKLQELDFVWDVQEYKWNQRLEELRAFVNKHNHARVPAAYPGSLGIWVRNQRRALSRLQQGEPSTLTEKRLQALKELQFEGFTSREDSWKRHYEDLLAFYNEHGHANVPEDYHKNFQLGQFVMNQRIAYRKYADGERTALNEERIEQLERVGFSWKYRQDKWNEMKDRLVAYYEANGHLRFTDDDKPNRDLRLWLNLQRYQYKRRRSGRASSLTEERVEALESEIPNFPWKGRGGSSPSKEDWSRLFAAMRDKGITPELKPKSHWFEGMNPFANQVKNTWTEDELLALWNSEDEDDP
jgi:hypothetical protein